jgi:hypothetical protein
MNTLNISETDHTTFAVWEKGDFVTKIISFLDVRIWHTTGVSHSYI